MSNIYPRASTDDAPEWKLPPGLKGVLFLIEEMTAAGSWDAPTLRRIGEIVAALDRNAGAYQSQEIARLTERCDAYKEALEHKDENIAILVGLASRWDFLPGSTDRDDVRKSALYQRGDTVQIWANEGDIWLLKHLGAALASSAGEQKDKTT